MAALDLIVIIGPTAAGKSARAMDLAPRMGGEIISADSRHVYRRMDIGTNKPSLQDRSIVPHHLIDLREPREPFSLSEYVRLARAAMQDARERGKVPLLVGGTGQYARALLEGWRVPEVPPREDIRLRWQALADAQGPAALADALRARDSAALEAIDPRNTRRVIRALEVIEVTGERWSDLQRREPLDLSRTRIEVVNLPRPELYARADARLMAMVEAGWLDEVRALLADLDARGIEAESLPSMSALGYRQMIAVARGQMTLDDAIVAVKHDTRRFIRAQDTWFRKYDV